MTCGGWWAVSMLASVGIVSALLVSVRTGSATLGFAIVPLIALSAFAEIKAEKLERERPP